MNMTIEEYQMQQQRMMMGQIQNGFAHMRQHQERLRQHREMELRVMQLELLNDIRAVLARTGESVDSVIGDIGEEYYAVRTYQP